MRKVDTEIGDGLRKRKKRINIRTEEIDEMEACEKRRSPCRPLSPQRGLHAAEWRRFCFYQALGR